MSKEFYNQEIKKIMENKEYPYPLNLAMATCWLILNLKGNNVKILEMKRYSSLADYFILADAQNRIQVQTMIEEISFYSKKFGYKVRSKEGVNESNWTLLDQGDIITNIFIEDSREILNLEALWPEAPHIKIPDSFYYPNNEENNTEQSELNDDKNNDQLKNYY